MKQPELIMDKVLLELYLNGGKVRPKELAKKLGLTDSQVIMAKHHLYSLAVVKSVKTKPVKYYVRDMPQAKQYLEYKGFI